MRLTTIIKAAKVTGKYAMALTETIFSAIIIALLYIIYIPFGIGRALFNRKAIRAFYDDVFFIIDGVSARMHKRGGDER